MSSEDIFRPFVVGLGGTSTPGSSTEKSLKIALTAAESAGADVQIFGCEALASLPHYLTSNAADTPRAILLLKAIRAADGVIIASPGYHGTISGLLKNAIDYLEETAKDDRPYLEGVPVGLIATAYGWQATGSTLVTLRTIIHALRGWPTPFGAAINSSSGIFVNDECIDSAVANSLETVGRQVVEFARMKKLATLRNSDERSTDPAKFRVG
ncbi:NADPH-dependent FMN reductase [Paraburkholderia elongata]|uniref:FMN reductase n=1 Tax=Paraburkholderia elongata TaxID=2675747 RepID=A0A972NVX0_9BURK|nr:NAD(P)H-dependent oxidoreductase [Paraburkholderia elongata]NPT60851.1 FMN reductase [Paraburkholderia elongata]